MKIAIISEYNSFSTIGGTEYYVKMLVEGMCVLGVDVLLITKGTTNNTERMNISLEGKSYNISFISWQEFSKSEIKQKSVSKSYSLIIDELNSFKPDIIHVHTLTTFFNILHIELVAKVFKKIVFTAHVPVHFCAKGDLIQNNNKICNGEIVRWKCSVCLFTKNNKAGISNLILKHYAYPLHLIKKLTTNAVHIISPSLWQKEQISKNGFNKNNITVIRQALSTTEYANPSLTHTSSTFTIGYLGRLSPEKGSTLLLSLISKLITLNSNIKFVLAVPENSNKDELKKLDDLTAQHKQIITVLKDINSSNKNEFFDVIDCLFIPSFFLETGPIVLLEALYYNKKVLAPNVGGTLEFSQEYPDDVICYDWNDLDAAYTVLKNLNYHHTNSTKNHVSHFKEKEKRFLASHINVYKSMLALY